LRNVPDGVPKHLFKDLVDVSRAYSTCGVVGITQLLDGALEVSSGPIDICSPLLLSFAFLIYLFIIGPVAYKVGVGWSYSDSLYYCISLVATLGNEHIHPDTYRSKVASITYLIVGIGLLYALVVTCIVRMLSRYEELTYSRELGDLLAEHGYGRSQADLALEDLVALESPALRAAKAPQAPNLLHMSSTREVTVTSIKAKRKRCCCHWITTHHLQAKAGGLLWLLMSVVAVGALVVYAVFDLQNFTDALYWALMTSATAGVSSVQSTLLLQDHADSEAQKGIALSLLIIVLPIFTLLLLQLGECCLESRSEHVKRQNARNVLPMDVLADFGTGGGVSKLEFLCAALLALDKVTAHDLWKSLELFRQLDSESVGLLSADDLAALRHGRPKQKVATPVAKQRNLEPPPCAGTRSSGSPPPALDHTGDAEQSRKHDKQRLLDDLHDSTISEVRPNGSDKDISFNGAELCLKDAVKHDESESLAREVPLLRLKLRQAEASADREKQLRESAETGQCQRCQELKVQVQEQERTCLDLEQQLQKAQQELSDKTRISANVSLQLQNAQQELSDKNRLVDDYKADFVQAQRHALEADARCDAIHRDFESAELRWRQKQESADKDRELHDVRRDQNELKQAVHELRDLSQGLCAEMQVQSAIAMLPMAPPPAHPSHWQPALDWRQRQQRWSQWQVGRPMPQRPMSMPRTNSVSSPADVRLGAPTRLAQNSLEAASQPSPSPSIPGRAPLRFRMQEHQPQSEALGAVRHSYQPSDSSSNIMFGQHQ